MFRKICLTCLLIIAVITYPVSAHPGRTDANGGHVDRSTGQYHYHNPDGTIKSAPAAPVISVYVDGNKLTFDVPPAVENNRTLVPVRAIFEALGATVSYNEKTQTVTAIKGATTVILQLGKVTATVNNKPKTLDVPAKNIKGRTMVPIRFVSEALGASVQWDAAARTIYITSPGANSLPSVATVVYAIDVGQADAILVISGQSSMLIDGGDNDDGAAVVKFIKDRGVKSLDVIIATHPDADHVGGLDQVINSIDAKRVIQSKEVKSSQTYTDYANAVKAKKISTEYPNNQKFTIGSAQVEILGPGKDYTDVNDDSVVARVSTGAISFLFTGDMESEAEKDMLTKLGPSTVLKVGHHGSSTSTSQALIDKVKPKISIISVGTGNKYKHPAQSTIDRLIKAGSAVYRTDKNGMVYVWTDGKTYKTIVKKAS